MGQALAFAPNFNAAKISAGRIFQLLDRTPKIISPIVLNEDKNWVSYMLSQIKFLLLNFSIFLV